MGLSPRGYPATTWRLPNRAHPKSKNDLALPLWQGMGGMKCDIVSEGASAQGDFTVSWVALGMLGREAEGGRPPRVPNLLTSPPRSNPANHPESKCRFNQYNETSKILRGKLTRCRVIQAGQRSWFGGGSPAPREHAPLGMTKTPTLRVSADLLGSKVGRRRRRKVFSAMKSAQGDCGEGGLFTFQISEEGGLCQRKSPGS
jgi:hypothetical protein